MLQMLHDMYSKMQSEIQNERKNREAAEETILKILEEVCDPELTSQKIL